MHFARRRADGVRSRTVEVSPDASKRDALERDVRARVEAGDIDGASSLAIRAYGGELIGFLQAIARDEALAADAFAIASQQLWSHLARFRWEATLRTWFYQLGRNVLYQLRRDPRRRPDRNLPLSILTSIADIQRQPTAPYQKTESKNALRALRESLDPEDHELLILRLDRGMSWKDIARATAGEDERASSLDARAAALRKRYERLKQQLRERMVECGLLDDDT